MKSISIFVLFVLSVINSSNAQVELNTPLQNVVFQNKFETVSQIPSMHQISPENFSQSGFASSDSQATYRSKNIFHDVRNYFMMYMKDGWHIISAPARLDGKSGIRLAGTLAITGAIYANDQEILDGLQKHRGDAVYDVIADIGNDVEKYGLASTMNPYYVGGAIVGYVFNIKKLEEVSVQLHETMFIGATIRIGIVHVSGRARPRDKKGANFFKFNSGSSFFSGHTANAFQLATILSHHVNFKPFTLCSYAFASIIAFQRLDTGAHWPSDVFLGAAYGIAISKAIIGLHDKRKINLAPAISDRSIGMQLRYEF